MKATLTAESLSRFQAAAKRSMTREIEVECYEQAPGCSRWYTSCLGTCDRAEALGHRHEVESWWDGGFQCDCPAKYVCQHVGAIVASDGFAIPDPPSASILAGLLDAGRAIFADDSEPALKLGRLRQNYDAITTQVRFLVADREEQRTSAVPSTSATKDQAAAGAPPADRGSEEPAVTEVERPTPIYAHDTESISGGNW